MREILFRGKTEKGEWVYGDLLHPDLFGNGYSIEDFTRSKNNCFDVIPETVGQYTGLADKNGKKIFEGDVVKCKHEWKNWNTSLGNDEQDFLKQKIRGAYGKYIDKTASDIFGQRYYYFRNYAIEYYAPNGGYRVRNGSCFYALTKNYILNRELEVTGNIHDNPELIGGGENA